MTLSQVRRRKLVNRNILLCDVSDLKCVLTAVAEKGNGTGCVGEFLSQSYDKKNEVIIIKQSWDSVLADLLIGAQLHNCRFSEKTALCVTVFAEPEAERAALSGFVGEMAAHAMEKGLLVQLAIRSIRKDSKYLDRASWDLACAGLQIKKEG